MSLPDGDDAQSKTSSGKLAASQYVFWKSAAVSAIRITSVWPKRSACTRSSRNASRAAGRPIAPVRTWHRSVHYRLASHLGVESMEREAGWDGMVVAGQEKILAVWAMWGAGEQRISARLRSTGDVLTSKTSFLASMMVEAA